MEEDFLEIIIKVDGEREPRKVSFNELYPLRDQIESIMFLWNANSYYVDCLDNVFIINGGRKLRFPQMGHSVIEYRKRTSMQVSAVGAHEPQKQVEWIIGLRGAKEDILVLKIDESGRDWVWINHL